MPAIVMTSTSTIMSSSEGNSDSTGQAVSNGQPTKAAIAMPKPKPHSVPAIIASCAASSGNACHPSVACRPPEAVA